MLIMVHHTLIVVTLLLLFLFFSLSQLDVFNVHTRTMNDGYDLIRKIERKKMSQKISKRFVSIRFLIETTANSIQKFTFSIR